MFVFYQQEINGVYNGTILGAAIMVFTSFIIFLRRKQASLEKQRTAKNIPLGSKSGASLTPNTVLDVFRPMKSNRAGGWVLLA